MNVPPLMRKSVALNAGRLPLSCSHLPLTKSNVPTFTAAGALMRPLLVELSVNPPLVAVMAWLMLMLRWAVRVSVLALVQVKASLT